jgi:hypothetical protein
VIEEELLSTLSEIDSDVITSSIKYRLKISEKIYLESLQNMLLPYYFKGKIIEEMMETIKYSNNMQLEKTTCFVEAKDMEEYLIAV